MYRLKQILLSGTFFILILSLFTSRAFAQESPFHFSGYVDTYYSHETDENGSNLRLFSVAAPVKDEFRINLAQVSGIYQAEKIRGILTLHYGDIPRYNWPQQPNEYLQYLQEANAGFSPAKNLWIDFGYFITHIGAESIMPINNIASSVSLAAFFEPIYQSGVRVSYDFNPNFYGSIYLLNGFNALIDNNKNKSFGLQAGVRVTKNFEVVYNNLTGNEQPSGSKGKVRVFNNFIFKAAFKKVNLVLAGDYVYQQRSAILDTNASGKAFGGSLTLNYKIDPKFSFFVRGEMYSDKEGFLSGIYTGANGEQLGFKGAGLTFGLEHRPLENAYIRFETRFLQTDNALKIFTEDAIPSNTRTEVLMTTGIIFNQ